MIKVQNSWRKAFFGITSLENSNATAGIGNHTGIRREKKCPAIAATTPRSRVTLPLHDRYKIIDHRPWSRAGVVKLSVIRFLCAKVHYNFKCFVPHYRRIFQVFCPKNTCVHPPPSLYCVVAQYAATLNQTCKTLAALFSTHQITFLHSKANCFSNAQCSIGFCTASKSSLINT